MLWCNMWDLSTFRKGLFRSTRDMWLKVDEMSRSCPHRRSSRQKWIENARVGTPARLRHVVRRSVEHVKINVERATTEKRSIAGDRSSNPSNAITVVTVLSQERGLSDRPNCGEKEGGDIRSGRNAEEHWRGQKFYNIKWPTQAFVCTDWLRRR